MKQRYRWKKYLSILCVMALLMPMLSSLQVHAEELPEEIWQEQETEPTEEESIADTQVSENSTDMEVTEETSESINHTEVEEEISSADEEEIILPDTEITEIDVEDTVTETENEELSDEKEDTEKPDEDAADIGTVSGNEAVADIPDIFPEEDVSTEDTDQAVSNPELERIGMESYTDAQGNVFTYQTGEDGNVTITGITVSGAALLIPEIIGELPVTAVANEGSCVVTNPEIRIPELVINCHTIDTKAFSGLTIGTLTIGEKVKELSVGNKEGSSLKFYYGQFMNCTVETVVFAATNLSVGCATGSSYNEVFGPFDQAVIGTLEVADGVTRIPEKMFSNSVMELDTLELRTERIGAYAFSGKDIIIHHLIIGEKVKLLEEYSDSTEFKHYWEQFSYSTIGTFTCLAEDMELEQILSSKTYTEQYGPFYKSNIGNLEIGSTVTKIPNHFLHDANIKIGELNLTQSYIGAYAFSGNGIEIETLTLHTTVETLGECYRSTELEHYWEQFSYSTIGTLVYLADSMELEHTTGAKTYTSQRGPFYQSNIGNLEIGSSVTRIPELFLNNANISIEELNLTQSYIGAYAFSGSGIEIGTLTLNSTVKELGIWNCSDDLFQHWEQFSYSTIGTLIYLADGMVLERTMGGKTYTDQYAAFYQSNIGNLEIGSSVTRIPELFLNNANISIEELNLTQSYIGAYAFSGSGIEIGTLTLDSSEKELGIWCYSSDLFQHWEQFSYTTIGKLIYLSEDMKLEAVSNGKSSVDQYAAFYKSTIGTLQIGENVTKIPELFLNNANISIEELNLTQSYIGAYAFSGNEIEIGTLTVNTTVKELGKWSCSTKLHHHWEQFSYTTIGTFIYLSDEMDIEWEMEWESYTDYYAAFYKSTIGTLQIGENVTRIPELFLNNANISIEELDLTQSYIGAYAFSGSGIEIGTLTLNTTVKEFGEWSYSTRLYQHWEQFSYSVIGTIRLYAPKLEVLKTIGSNGSSVYIYGPFKNASVGSLEIGTDVEMIPDYFLREAVMSMEELEIHVPVVGAEAFAGSSISIGKLTIGEEATTFAENYFSTDTYHYWKQFSEADIGELHYDVSSLKLEKEEIYTNYGYGPFHLSRIGKLYLSDAVEKIPNYLFCNAKMNLEEFFLNVPVIGCYSFSGQNIRFGKLTIGEAVALFSANADNDNSAFAKTEIEELIYYAPEAKMETLDAYVYGPFAYSTINGLIIGDNVKEIPYGCFREAVLTVEELTIENAAIGYAAFCGRSIHIRTLNIGKNVNYLGALSQQLKTFYRASIGTLNYNSCAVDPEWSKKTSAWGMFEQSIIGELVIGADVEVIPAFWFRNAEMELETLIIPCGWSYYAFNSRNIIIGTLILNGDVKEINHLGNSNMAFEWATIETVQYEIPSAVFTATKAGAYGPFYCANIKNFIIGECVEYLDYRLLSYCQLTNCYVYPVKASDSFLNQKFDYQPECTNLHIHYNSDFKEYFSAKVTEYHWLCVDYFDAAYGEKWIDEETGEYLVEVFKTCRICGYEETEEKELDSSYDIYLSVPVEIPLSFDAEKKAYTGSETIYAYGTLGDAYEGICILAETNHESYGKAVMGGNTYDISSFLSVGFTGGETAVFTSGQLTENAALVENGQTEGLYQEEMTVAVDAVAFLESGAGAYQISIPMRFDFRY